VVSDFRKSDAAFYLNLKIVFLNNTVLYVKEYTDSTHRKYSFQWQYLSGNRIARWDNAPHYPNLPTFPHHVHLANGDVVESHDISLEEIMLFIISKQVP